MSVADIGFMVDRLGQDCSPLQFLRELTMNGLEAIEATRDRTGEVVWDYDPVAIQLENRYKLAVIDTGVGMTGEEMVRYINSLSSSIHPQSHQGNFGVGAKIAAATRNHEGLVYLSWVGGIGSMVYLWRDPTSGQYGLRQFEKPDGTFAHWAHVEDALKPPQIREHGTKVILLGNDPEQNTMEPPAEAQANSRWIAKYLNTRYYEFPDGVAVKAREGYDAPEGDDRTRLRTVTGMSPYLADHAQESGSVALTGATARWWILKDDEAFQHRSTFINWGGHVAALWRNELYEMAASRAATTRLQTFGVIFGSQRVVIYIEPDDDLGTVISNTARTHLLIDSEPLPWAEWAAEFRDRLPEEIRAYMDEVTSGASSTDHAQAIRERLRQIRELLKLSRYRLTPEGQELATGAVRAGGEPGDDGKRKPASQGGGGRSGGRGGNLYSLFISPDGDAAEEASGDSDPQVRWISVVEGTRNAGDLEDRAAKYLRSQHLLMANADFRVFTDMVERWVKQYPSAPRDKIVDVVREWFEQNLVETVLGVLSLRGSRPWADDEIERSLSEEALTAAVMPRYHVDLAIKRTLGARLGSLRAAS